MFATHFLLLLLPQIVFAFSQLRHHLSFIKQKHQDFQTSYPVRFTYINKINQWWPAEKIAAGMGVPGYANSTIYNYIALAFWSTNGPLDIVSIWADPVKYFGNNSVFGRTNQQIQKQLKKLYNDNGIKILISAFGATEFPTTAGVNPLQCANKLADFVIKNNLDGVDIDWEDNAALNMGKGQEWLITFQTQLRSRLPNHIISHAPQAPYFKAQHYKNGGYITIHQKVGHSIDFYNIQFYNQEDTRYDTFQTLFERSGSVFSGTSLTEIINRGVPSQKVVIGKPVTEEDASNTGWVDHFELGKWINKGYSKYNWYSGVMYWQYSSDLNGKAIKASTGQLKQMCVRNKNCKPGFKNIYNPHLIFFSFILIVGLAIS